MNVTRKLLSELRRPERNVRMHTDKQLKEFRRSIEMFGQIRPIVVDEDGVKLGTLKDILSPSRQQVYVVEGERQILIPAVPEFILETNVDGGYIKVRLIEGM